jgi:mRNA-degrading endonuclease toxin of MazEF toxin-antitoxin module
MALAPAGRPAVLVSNDRANATAARLRRGVVTVVPITSNVTRVFPFQALLTTDETGQRVDCTSQCEQIRSVPVRRLGAVGLTCVSVPGTWAQALAPAAAIRASLSAGAEQCLDVVGQHRHRQ